MNTKTIWIIAAVAAVVTLAIAGSAILFMSSESDLMGLLGGGRTYDAQDLVRAQADFVLRPADFEVDYFVESDGEKRRGNRLVILEMGEVEGKEFVLETGRVDGWYINLRKNDRTDIAPSTYTNTIDIFETREGARLAFSPEKFKAYNNADREFEFLDKSCNYGNDCILYTSERHDPATGLTVIRYDVAFLYGNALVWISVTGLDIDISEDHIHEAAQIVLEKMDSFAESN